MHPTTARSYVARGQGFGKDRSIIQDKYKWSETSVRDF
jgi:hypothetical protein